MKITRLNIGDHLLEYQLNMIGKTSTDALKNSKWHSEWSLKEWQYKKFKSYAIVLLKKTFKCNRTKAEETFNWFYHTFGLTVLKE